MRTAWARAKAELGSVTNVETATLDVRDRARFAQVADEVEQRLGPVSLLFNNAGVSASQLPAAQMSFEQWDWGVGINLLGVINGVQTFLPRILERGAGGHVVNTASGAGLAATASGVLYCTTKFAVVGMAETLALELEPLGVGVSVLCPGPVSTNIVASSQRGRPDYGAGLSEADRASAAERTARIAAFLSQGVTPEAVADMVLAAVRENRLHIITDRLMLPYVEARQQRLLDAFPSA